MVRAAHSELDPPRPSLRPVPFGLVVAWCHLGLALCLYLATSTMALDGHLSVLTLGPLLLLQFPLGLAAPLLPARLALLPLLASSVLWGLAAWALARAPWSTGRLRLLALGTGALLLAFPLGLLWLQHAERAEARATWPVFAARFEALEPGLTREQVLERLGPADAGGPDSQADAPAEPRPWMAYHLDRTIDRRGLAVLRFEEGRLAGVDLAPGFDIPFDAEDWRRSGPDRRACMANDLIAGERLVGLSRDEVTALIGPPDAWTRRGPADSTWYLGHERALLYQGLEVLWGEDGRVRRVRLFED